MIRLLAFFKNSRNLFANNDKTFRRLPAVCIIMGALMIFMLAPKFDFSKTHYKEGDIVQSDIIAKRKILLEDKIATNNERQRRLSNMPLIFDYDPLTFQKIETAISSAFEGVRTLYTQKKTNSLQLLQEERLSGIKKIEQTEKILEIQKKIQSFKTLVQNLNEKRNEFNAPGRQVSPVEKIGNIDEEIAALEYLIEKHEKDVFFRQKERGKNFVEQKDAKSNSPASNQKERDSQILEEFLGKLGITLDPEHLSYFESEYYSEPLQNNIITLLKPYYREPIQGLKSDLEYDQESSAELINLEDASIIRQEKISNVANLDFVRQDLFKKISEYGDNAISLTDKKILEILSQKLLKPSLTLNKREMEKAKQGVLENTEKVYVLYKQGEIIARKGGRLTNKESSIVNEYRQANENLSKLPQMLGIALFVFGALYVMFLLEKMISSGYKNFTILTTSIFLTLSIGSFFLFIAINIGAVYQELPLMITSYFFPTAISSLLVCTLIGKRTALMVVLTTGIFMSIMLGGNIYYFAYVLAGGIFAAIPSDYASSRLKIVQTGIYLASTNLSLVIIIFLIQGTSFEINWLYACAGAIFSGLLSAILTMFLLPLFEYLFDVTTDIKLLELSNLNHPALKELSVKAPGSYQHSIMVGNLAEAGALSISANALLCRVASYYHDIGKTVLPHCFVENFRNNSTGFHHQLNDPYRSAELIIKHVEEGIMLGNKYNLGKTIVDIIKQHHGSTAVQYFFKIAVEQAEQKGKHARKEAFCYKWGKPRTKESAIIMLADSCEASTRSLNEFTSENIQGMVTKVTNGLLINEQLDESGITLKEFKTLVETFTSTLISTYHTRISYPETV